MSSKAERGRVKLRLNYRAISAIYPSVVMKVVSFAILTGSLPEPANLGLRSFLPETEREALELDPRVQCSNF
jgi:hypothetical protein